jgi:putative tricarboxylic transport membrane protein
LIPSLQIGDPLGPKAFPYLIGIGLLVSAAWLLLETLQAGKSGVADPPDLADQADQVDRAPEDNRHLLVIAGVVAWIAFYFALFEPVGFLLATPVSLLGLMVYFNRNKWVANVLTSVLFPVGIYFLFSKVLGVNLAKGLLPF